MNDPLISNWYNQTKHPPMNSLKSQFSSQQYIKKGILFFVLLLCTHLLASERPFIWVDSNDRDAILNKIDQQQWASSYYHKFKQRLDNDIREYKIQPNDFLSHIPFAEEAIDGEIIPPLRPVNYDDRNAKKFSSKHMFYLQVAIDCGLMYYLTQEEQYAQCALDILYTYVIGINQLELDTDTRNGGWLYTNGQHLREAREIGAQIPIVYDFVSPFIALGGLPYDFAQQKKVGFPHQEAQEVFRTYVELAINRGHTGSNWSVLESLSFAHNLLALDDEDEREHYLDILLTEGSSQQDPLTTITSVYKMDGDVYPETSQYSSGVASLTCHLMVLLNKYKPSLHLGQEYAKVALALSRWEDMRFPNGEIVRFGDGHRHMRTSYDNYELAYHIGMTDSVPALVEKYGNLLTTAINEGRYQRGGLGGRPFSAHPYLQPLDLLWFQDTIEGTKVSAKVYRSDNMRHAALYLQRNLSSTGNPEDGMMYFVAGAPMVHGNANGMNMELYGKGQVLGAEQGRVRYGNEMHENYSRLFAAHNTVIVNGSSRGDGHWSNLGINPIELKYMEPMPQQEALSPYYSFTQTHFIDDKGNKSEAEQQRTMALIRTSPTTAYYVDVFRSKSKLTGEYHDYLYHNIGDSLEILNDDMAMQYTPERYMANADMPWRRNDVYRHPGWHYFEDVITSDSYDKDVNVRFHTHNVKGGPLFMNMHIIGAQERAYTQVMAPFTYEAPMPYNKQRTPTLVIRKKGEAWSAPFAIVFEPVSGHPSNASIISVEELICEGQYCGLLITSKVKEGIIKQYVLTQDSHQSLMIPEYELSFNGAFAIVTTDEEGEVLDLYIGQGTSLKYRNSTLTTPENKGSSFVELR